ncbi:ATP-binding cassette domain-containing protein [Arthrobacter sp. alpha11c]
MTQQAPPLLSLHGVSKTFPGVRALNNMGLELRHGEVLALVGENGAGKSTLMKLLSGIYTPDSGTFELNGTAFVPDSPKHAQELGISIIHQEFNLMPDLTVAQNIFIGREPRRFGVLNERALEPPDPGAAGQDRAAAESPSESGAVDGRQAADGGDRESTEPRFQSDHHGRANGRTE